MPGQRTPLMDDRNKAMDVIGKLGQGKPAPGQPGAPDPQTGQPGPPGPPQPSIQPSWEEDAAFCAKLAKAYLIENFIMAEKNPDGYQNIQLWGQAQEAKANQPGPPPPVKGSVSVSLKGADLGDPSVTAALDKAGILPQGIQTTGDQQRQAELQVKAQAKQVNGLAGEAPPPGMTQ